MSRDQIIAVVGISDEETAHLRLLLRKCASLLEHSWRWGDESGADLVVVDPGTFGGQMARTRALSAGVRCAIFSSEAVDDADLVLRRPLLTANVIAVLNQAGSAPRPGHIAAQGADFYTRDLGETSTGSATVALRPHDPRSTGPRPDAPAPGLDELLRAEPIELRRDEPRTSAAADRSPPPMPAPFAPPPSTAPLAPVVRAPTAEAKPATPQRKYANRAAMLVDTAPRGLREFLDGDLLRGPARFSLPDAPSLALDPKLKMVHSPSGLGALEPYCHATWRLSDWQMLTTGELNELRASQPAQPYSRLVWLDVLVHSNGHLASNLDPGGTFRLKSWIEIERDLSRYFRIASALLQPARLHEIAATSGAPMADVFDVVNAYDAIGLLEWQPRARRDHTVAAPSLLQRLRNPFGKS